MATTDKKEKTAEPTDTLYRCAVCGAEVTSKHIISIGALCSARHFGVEIGYEVCDACYGD